MVTKRRKPEPRTVSIEYDTGAEERAAKAKDRFIATLGGIAPQMFWVIYDRKTNEEIECKTVTKSEIDDRVALLNRYDGNPPRVANQSWGKLTKERQIPGKGVKDGAISLKGGITVPSPTEIVERIYGHPPTRLRLRVLQASGETLSRKEVRELIGEVAPHEWRAFADTASISNRDLVESRKKRVSDFLRAVSKQLDRKFGIQSG